MSKPFEERNQTETAKRKLKSLAKNSHLDVEFVTALANFNWDYDPRYRNEATGWVRNDDLPPAAEQQLEFLADTLGLSHDFTLTRERAVSELIDAYQRCSADDLWSRFLTGAAEKNAGRVSEFASWQYLRGLNENNAQSLDWNPDLEGGKLGIVSAVFLKFFRGGAIERYRLRYLWCDLQLELPYRDTKSKKKPAAWLPELLDRIETLPAKSRLNDLIGCCKGLVGGDKFFKQTVLQALSYADVLQVNGLPVTNMFIAERRSELAPHFYSNEWTFPLRFWSTNGGGVNRDAVPAT